MLLLAHNAVRVQSNWTRCFSSSPNSAYFNTEVKDKDMFIHLSCSKISTITSPMKKKLIIYMEMAAILKVINVSGSSTSRPLGFYTGCIFTNTLLKQELI